MSQRNVRHGRTWLAASVAALTVSGAVAGCSSSSGGQSAGTTQTFAGAAQPAGSWAAPNGDLANTRDAAGARISLANVAHLKEAWTYRLPAAAAASLKGAGSIAAAPVVTGGVVYLQDLYSNVYAISLATGKLKWEYQLNVAMKSGPGPDGVAVSGGAVYGMTPSTAFALNAANGKVLWSNGGLLGKGQGTFEIQPAVANGRVYLASAYGSAPGGGVLFALNAANGKKLWGFNTVNGPEPGVAAIPAAGAGGAWDTPLVGTDGSVTFGIGNPYQSIGSAVSHPSRGLYTDSEVNLDAATGKLRWYYQAVPDDFRDWDMQLSPISVTVGGVPAIIGGGKMGDVYAFNAATGTLLWQTPVGVHNGHDDDSRLLLEHKLTITYPYTTEPAALGGILTDMAAADGSAYVVTNDDPITYAGPTDVLGSSGSGAPAGEVEALSLATGKVEWDKKVQSLPLGAATVSNDLVFTTLEDGELLALNRSNGAIVHDQKLPGQTNAPIAVAGNTVLVPVGGLGNSSNDNAQLIAYTAP